MSPIYERKCIRCHAKFNHLCKIQDRHSQKSCPNCQCPETVPVLSATPTNFKFADDTPFKGRA